MYSGGFYPYPTPEEKWAWWSRHIMVNRYMPAPKPVYETLLKLAEGCGAILHFGGVSVEQPFEAVAGPNLRGLYHVYEAARKFALEPRDILVEVGRRKMVGGQEDLIVDVAYELAHRG